MARRGPLGGFSGSDFDPGPNLFFTADKELGGAPDLEEIVCFLVRDFNGLPPYNGVQWSTTDISYVVFQIEFAKMSESPSPINVKPHAQ